jgi:hypothetical protein
MSIVFDDTGEYADHGSGASLDNIAAGTCCAWVRMDTAPVTSGHTQRIVSKGANVLWLSWVNSAGNTRLNASVNRATQSTLCATDTANYAAFSAGAWVFCVSTWNLAGASGDQRVYIGSTTLPPAEPSAYATQRVGSGAQTTDAADPLYVGNLSTATNLVAESAIAFVGLWTRQLSVNELYQQWIAPRPTTNCVLFTFPGLEGASAQQTDWSGTANHGTITGTPGLDVNPAILAPFAWANHREGDEYAIAAAASTIPVKYHHYRTLWANG